MNNGIIDKKDEFWNMLNSNGKFIIKKYVGQRTLNQNAYLHAIFTRIAEDTGEDDPEYIKYHFKSLYLKKYSTKKNIEYIGNTSKLNKKEFGEFVDKILNNMAKFGYKYPTPEEYLNGEVL